MSVYKGTRSRMKCRICCGKTFANLVSLNVHLLTHKNNGAPFVCIVCKKQFKSGPSLRKHVLFHVHNFHDRNFLVVLKNPGYRKVRRYLHLKRAKSTVGNNSTSKWPYECGTCGKAFAYRGILKLHLRTHRIHRCEFCNKSFRRFRDLQSHYSIDKHYKCVICSGFFNCDSLMYHDCMSLSGTNLKNGQKIGYAVISKDVAKDKNLNCRERNIRDSGAWYTCSVCSKSFENKKEFELHTCLQIDGEPYCYEELSDAECSDSDKEMNFCTECGARRSKGESCSCQNPVTPDSKPHICQLCFKAFQQQNDFEEHACLQIKDNPQVANGDDVNNKSAFALTRGNPRKYQIALNSPQVVPYDHKLCPQVIIQSVGLEPHKCLPVKREPSSDEEITEHCDFVDGTNLCSVCGENPIEGHCHCRPTNPEEVPYVCQVCSKTFCKIVEYEAHRCVKEPCGYGLYYITDQKTCFLAQEIGQDYLQKPQKRRKPQKKIKSQKKLKLQKKIKSQKKTKPRKKMKSVSPCKITVEVDPYVKLCEFCGKSIAKEESCKCTEDKISDHDVVTSPLEKHEMLLCTRCGAQYYESGLCKCEGTSDGIEVPDSETTSDGIEVPVSETTSDGIEVPDSETLARDDISKEVLLCTHCGSTYTEGAACECQNVSVSCNNVINPEPLHGLDSRKVGKPFLVLLIDCRTNRNENRKCEESIVKLEPMPSSTLVIGSAEMHLCKDCGCSSPCKCENSTFSYNNFPDIEISSGIDKPSKKSAEIDARMKRSKRGWEILENFKSSFLEVSTESIPTPYICKVCSKQFVTCDVLQEHIKQHFNGHFEICPHRKETSIGKCKYCHMIYQYIFSESSKNLAAKLDQVAPDSEGSSGPQAYRTVSEPNSDYYMCKKCKKLFRSSRRLNRTRIDLCVSCDVSRSRDRRPRGMPEIVRTKETIASVTTEPQEAIELPRHPGGQCPGVQYKCGLCSKVFPNESDLKTHFFARHLLKWNMLSRTKLWEKWKTMFNCHICCKLRNQEETYNRHQAWHKYRHLSDLNCHKCALQFAERHELNEHIRLHSVEVPYRCKGVFI